MRTRASTQFAVSCLLLLAACAAPPAGDDADSLGAGGHDVVAYFTEGRLTQGSPAHATTWDDREWHFASAEHRRMFREEPGRYAPAYDGHCAWALSQGRLSRGRPEHWAIHEGRLFFNCNAEVHERWLQDRERLIGIADREWAERGGD